MVTGTARLGPILSSVGKFIAIGLNYSDHAAESNMPIPTEPVIFMKAPSCLSGPNDPIMLPRDSLKVDYEIELGAVIGRTARYIEPSEALDHIAGYVCINDVSSRDFQLERGGSWDKGKGCDTSGLSTRCVQPSTRVSPSGRHHAFWVRQEYFRITR